MLGAVLAVLLCSCARITTERYAYINPTMNAVELSIDGYYLAPVTGEGPFPDWSDSVWVQLNPKTTLPGHGRKEYMATPEELSLSAGALKAKYKMSFADAFIASTALQLAAILVHKDAEFEALNSILPMVSLPYKRGLGGQ